MTTIRAAQDALEAARHALDAAVQAARAQGRTWAEIGEELDMTRQAAFKRFGRPVDPSTGEGLPRRGITDVAGITERVFRLIAAADFTGLRTVLNPAVADELNRKTIAPVWHQVLAEIGSLQRFSGSRVELPSGEMVGSDEQVIGTVICELTLECEAGNVLGRVAVDEESLVTGILLFPEEHGPLPF